MTVIKAEARFGRDLFSDPAPGWEPADESTRAIIGRDVVPHLSASCVPILDRTENSKGLGINSRNFKLVTDTKPLLLKRWAATDRSEAVRLMKLMKWVGGRGLPVPEPIAFRDGAYVVESGSSLWSLSTFIEGTYFSGGSGELAAAASMTGALAEALAGHPADLGPKSSLEHLTGRDHEWMEGVDRRRGRWEEAMGESDASLLEAHWLWVRSEWLRLRADVPEAGPRRLCHADLHPHNWLFRDGGVAAILDFESCHWMPAGYAVAFAGLKLGRQAVAFAGDPAQAPLAGEAFREGLERAYPEAHAFRRSFRDLALAEVFRRICLILRLNFEQNERVWNKVLPIQLGHLAEAHALFG
jgi:Ser/Thr protein kinase RdoA (MazF antagonist)